MSIKFFSKNNRGFLAESWLVLLLALVFGTSLVGIQLWLGPRIELNKLNETLDQVPVLVKGAASGKQVMLGEDVYYAALDANGRVAGWVVPATGQGFADRIDILIGVDRGVGTVKGIYILDQKETPGLGNKIIEAQWRAQFSGKKSGKTIGVIKSGTPAPHQILAVTGATISSVSVTDTVNATLKRLKTMKQALEAKALALESGK